MGKQLRGGDKHGPHKSFSDSEVRMEATSYSVRELVSSGLITYEGWKQYNMIRMCDIG